MVLQIGAEAVEVLGTQRVNIRTAVGEPADLVLAVVVKSHQDADEMVASLLLSGEGRGGQVWLAVLTEVLFDGTRLRSGPAYHTVDKIVSGLGIGIVGANRPRNNSMGRRCLSGGPLGPTGVCLAFVRRLSRGQQVGGGVLG